MRPDFFVPSPEFVRWLIDAARYRYIVDVGCGNGALLRALSAAGYPRLIGLDLDVSDAREQMPHTVQLWEGDARGHVLLQGGMNLLVFARPCHGGWVGETIQRASRDNESIVIGKPETVIDDMGEVARHAKQMTDVPLPDGNVAYRVNWHRGQPQTWELIEYTIVPGHRERVWLCPRGDQLVNFVGGYMRRSADMVTLLSMRVIDPWSELPRNLVSSYRHLLEYAERENPGNKGWLSPEGAFLACRYSDHDDFVSYLFGMGRDEMITLGWEKDPRSITEAMRAAGRAWATAKIAEIPTIEEVRKWLQHCGS